MGAVSRPGSAVADLTLELLGRLGRSEFVGALGDVFEHSPWVAERAFDDRPFATVEALHAAMTRVVRDAPRDAQLALLRAHRLTRPSHSSSSTRRSCLILSLPRIHPLHLLICHLAFTRNLKDSPFQT